MNCEKAVIASTEECRLCLIVSSLAQLQTYTSVWELGNQAGMAALISLHDLNFNIVVVGRSREGL